ncbi:MAG TPA: hypothetical protein VGF42_03640 [Caulobacteraceae bacterium]|jgi:hypothetical protein
MTSQTPARGAGADEGARILAKLGRVGSRRLVFDSGLVSLDDPRIVALHDGYDDLTKVFDLPAQRA